MQKVNAVVVDASVSTAWLFKEQATPTSEAVARALRDGVMVVPALWLWETANIVARAVRLGRVSREGAAAHFRHLGGLRVRIVPATASAAFGPTTELAMKHGLTAYDAAYLEIAVRERLPLATLDAELSKSAAEERVALFPENAPR